MIHPFVPRRARLALVLLLPLLVSVVALAAPGVDPTPYLAQGGLLFVDSGQSLGSAQSSAVALGDVDGDGDLDAVVANFDVPATLWTNQGGAQGGTEGSFASGGSLGGNAGLDIAVDDVDGDLDLDVVLIRDAFTDTLQILINQGGTQGGTQGTFLQNGQTLGVDLHAAVAVGPLDGGAGPDLYVARTVGRADNVWMNDGAGQFTDSGQSLGSASSLEVALDDLDGDGDLDAFVATGSGNRVWINQGGAQGGTAGNFVDSGQSLGATLTNGVATGDLDGDLDVDALTANVSSADRIWLNDGSGDFMDSGQSLGTGNSRDVALEDLDGDGDLDAFVAVSGPDAVWVNQGGAQGGTEGIFLSSGQSIGNTPSEGVALGDLDGDGDVDAFVANWPGGNLVYLNGGSPPPPENPVGWQLGIADAYGRVGRGVSVALDAGGRPHLSYFRHLPRSDGIDYSVMYAFWDGVRWSTQQVERFAERPEAEAVTSIALDSARRPHIVYGIEDADGDLHVHYATMDQGQWTIRPVETNPGVAIHVAIALDGAGTPHVSYQRLETIGQSSYETLRYARWTGASWLRETVEVMGGVQIGRFNAIAVDGAGNPHIAYLTTDDRLRYATRSGATWVIETVDADADSGASIVLDGAGVPHLSYIADFFQDVRYGHRGGGSWQIQTLFDAGGGAVHENTSLALDPAGRPSVVFSELTSDRQHTEIRMLEFDGSGWTNTIVDQLLGAPLDPPLALAIDPSDVTQLFYEDKPVGDVRQAQYAPQYTIADLGHAGQIGALSLGLARDLPALGFYDGATGQIVGARRAGLGWAEGAIDPLTQAINDTSTAVSIQTPYVTYYDPAQRRLLLARWDGSAWVRSVLDESGDVGRQSDLLFASGAAGFGRVAYWDATLRRIRIALFGPQLLNVTTAINLVGPALDATSGHPAIAQLPGADYGIAYFDGVNDDIRLATYNTISGAWQDQLAVGGTGALSHHLDLATDFTDGYPVLAYHDRSRGEIRLAHRAGGIWQSRRAVVGVSAVDGLQLGLGLGSRTRARIAYLDAGDGALRVATLRGGAWTVETVKSSATLADLEMALGTRPFLAYTDAAGGPYLALRTGTLDVAAGPNNTPSPPASWNILDACAAVLAVFFDDDLAMATGPLQLPGPSGSSADLEIFAGMVPIFARTPEGLSWIARYRTHGSEMGSIGLSDPRLMWDAYGTLQNFMPGLEALVDGRGHEVLVDQRMVDDALDVWTRIRDRASPALAAEIDAELAASNNLQDFVGMTFNEWAAAIGVNAATRYMPLLAHGAGP